MKRTGDDFLLVVRACAGLFVVVFHVFISGIFDHVDLERVLDVGPLDLSFAFTGCGEAGVLVFFVLSGYLMGKGFANERYGLDRQGIAAFYWARFLRIYPMLAFFMLVMITLGRTNAPTAAQTYGILARMFATQWHLDWSTWFPFFGHLWSIMTEVQFYLTVPLLGWLLQRFVTRRNEAVRVIAAAIAFGIAIRTFAWLALHPHEAAFDAVLAGWNVTIRQPLLSNLDTFVAGMALNYAAAPARIEPTTRRVLLFFGEIGAYFVFASYVTHYALFSNSLGMKDFWVIGLPAVTILFALHVIRTAEGLNAGAQSRVRSPLWLRGIVRAFAYCGTVTYGIYLWHLPFVSLPFPFSRPFGPAGNACVSIVLTYALATMVASVVHRAIEMPFDRLKRLVPPRRPATPHATRAAFPDPAGLATP